MYRPSNLRGLCQGQRAFAQDVAQIGVIGLHQRIGDSNAIEIGLPEAFDPDEIGLVHVRNLPPAFEEIILVIVWFGESDDSRFPSSVGSGEETVAALGAQQPPEGVGPRDLPSFVFGPELHHTRSTSQKSLTEAASSTARGSSSVRRQFCLISVWTCAMPIRHVLHRKERKSRTTAGTSDMATRYRIVR